jgi:hypothetical protein
VYWWSRLSRESETVLEKYFAKQLLLTVYSLRPKKNDVLGFKICPKKNYVLLNLACVHVHVAMQQSIST